MKKPLCFLLAGLMYTGCQAGNGNVIIGNGNTQVGDSSVIKGDENYNRGDNSFVFGNNHFFDKFAESQRWSPSADGDVNVQADNSPHTHQERHPNKNSENVPQPTESQGQNVGHHNPERRENSRQDSHNQEPEQQWAQQIPQQVEQNPSVQNYVQYSEPQRLQRRVNPLDELRYRMRQNRFGPYHQ